MDFLDPRKARAHHRRLVIGYIGLTIAIVLGTTLLVWAASGFGYNTKTGEIVENGLVFVDSHPGNAQIDLNGSYSGENTSARKVLPAGNYVIKISKTGYRDWSLRFVLQEHSVARYVYPFLFPKTLNGTVLKKYPSAPALVSASLDRHWLMVTSSDETTWEVYDTTKLDVPPTTLALAAGILTPSSTPASLKLVEWSSDNKNLLIKRTYSGGNEYIVINRDKPEESFNINTKFAISPQDVALKDKEVAQIYVLGADKSLRIANSENGTISQPLLSDVLSFKSYGKDLILFVTSSKTAGKAQVKIFEKDQSYNLIQIATSEKYLLDLAKFQGNFYYAVGGNMTSAISLFKDPMDSLKDNNLNKALPFLAMKQTGSDKLSFSANARFIASEAGQNFVIYDLEDKQYYRYNLATQISTPAVWMDGHRFITSSNGKVFVMDFDKSNQQQLSPTVLSDGAYFDRDYQSMFTLSNNAGSFDLSALELRAGEDLPKK